MHRFFNLIYIFGGFILFSLSSCLTNQDNKSPHLNYEIDSLIFQDKFDGDLSNWFIEVLPDSTVYIGIKDEQLVIDTDRGATVWLKQELSGNLLFRYKRRVVMENGPNDRLSDMNQFWMAIDPQNPNLFTRKGGFKEYDSLLMYYAGIGGNYNETTRFRKYNGDGNRILIYDLTDEDHLLKANHTYQIEVLVKDGATSVLVDKEEFFYFKDDNHPLTKGYFGIRSTWSRQIVDDFEVFRLK